MLGSMSFACQSRSSAHVPLSTGVYLRILRPGSSVEMLKATIAMAAFRTVKSRALSNGLLRCPFAVEKARGT